MNTLFETKALVMPFIDGWLNDESVKIIVCFSGGKDSVAMFLHLIDKGIDCNRIELHHHLVDGRSENIFDWACTESYCAAFAKHFGVKIVFSYREGGIMREIKKHDAASGGVVIEHEGALISCNKPTKKNTRRKFPAVHSTNMNTRWCSSIAKITVFNQTITNVCAYQRDINILVLTGERGEESQRRANYELAQWHTSSAKKRKKRIVVHYRPLQNWSNEDVWQIIAKHKVQPHPAYMLGWSRCSCQLCIFSSPNTWASISAISPEKVALIAETEEELSFTMYSKKTIFENMAKGESFVTQINYERWAQEALSVFTSPIICEIWKMPQGANSKESSGSL